MTVSDIAGHVSPSGMVGNPRRTRGLDAALLVRSKSEQLSTPVGNPRRTRGLRTEDLQGA